ncbi:MAG: hypothetical protein AB1345_05235 [Chloroflexota bacterium]
MTTTDFVWAAISFVLTLLVFSYLLGDNFLFRLTMHIFVGVAAGYAATVAWQQVIWPMLLLPLLSGSSLSERFLAFVPLVLSLLLLTKLSPRLSGWGSPSMGYLVGVGAAVAIGGGVTGTIFPQVKAGINQFDLETIQGGGWFSYMINGGIILLGTLSTLIYFHFGARPRRNQPPQRHLVIRLIAGVGKVFIAITFGAIFAGVYLAALTALIERLHFMWKFVANFLG